MHSLEVTVQSCPSFTVASSKVTLSRCDWTMFTSWCSEQNVFNPCWIKSLFVCPLLCLFLSPLVRHRTLCVRFGFHAASNMVTALCSQYFFTGVRGYSTVFAFQWKFSCLGRHPTGASLQRLTNTEQHGFISKHPATNFQAEITNVPLC